MSLWISSGPHEFSSLTNDNAMFGNVYMYKYAAARSRYHKSTDLPPIASTLVRCLQYTAIIFVFVQNHFIIR